MFILGFNCHITPATLHTMLRQSITQLITYHLSAVVYTLSDLTEPASSSSICWEYLPVNRSELNKFCYCTVFKDRLLGDSVETLVKWQASFCLDSWVCHNYFKHDQKLFCYHSNPCKLPVKYFLLRHRTKPQQESCVR